MATMRAKQQQNNLLNAVTTKTNAKGETEYALAKETSVDPQFRQIANYLLRTDVRQHNKYCPCCRQYDDS